MSQPLFHPLLAVSQNQLIFLEYFLPNKYFKTTPPIFWWVLTPSYVNYLSFQQLQKNPKVAAQLAQQQQLLQLIQTNPNMASHLAALFKK